MNIYSMSNNSLTSLNETVADAYQEGAPADVKSKHPVTDPTIIPYLTSWQKRGHTSLHGVVTAISEGKCVDAQVLMRYCRMCRIWETKKGIPKYNEWYDTHKHP